MALLVLKTNQVTELHRQPGLTVLITNPDNVDDAYMDSDPGVLLNTLAGAVPAGTKIAKNGGSQNIALFPANGIMYFRAASEITLRVVP